MSDDWCHAVPSVANSVTLLLQFLMHQKTVVYRSDFRFMTTDGRQHQRAGSVAIIICDGVAAAGAALVLVAAIGLLRRLTRDGKQESYPTSEETKDVAISNEEPSTLPFPWEPAADVKTTSSTDSARNLFMSNAHHDDDEDDNDEISTLHDKKAASQQHQLEFLASMTFANGGLRAPSCPCCI